MPGGAIRAIPCAGCLAMLANWLPEDGEMPLCRDADEDTEGCARCSKVGKSCANLDSIPKELDSEDLHLGFQRCGNELGFQQICGNDMTALKQMQEYTRVEVQSEVDERAREIYKQQRAAECSVANDLPDNARGRGADELSDSILALEKALKALIDKYERRGDAAPVELRRDLESLKGRMECVKNAAPHGAAGMAMDQLGVP